MLLNEEDRHGWYQIRFNYGGFKSVFFEKMRIKKMVHCRNYTDSTWLFSLIAPLPG